MRETAITTFCVRSARYPSSSNVGHERWTKSYTSLRVALQLLFLPPSTFNRRKTPKPLKNRHRTRANPSLALAYFVSLHSFFFKTLFRHPTAPNLGEIPTAQQETGCLRLGTIPKKQAPILFVRETNGPEGTILRMLERCCYFFIVAVSSLAPVCFECAPTPLPYPREIRSARFSFCFT